MSIFKETFKKFVRKQLRIREAVLGADNSGGSRLDATNVILNPLLTTELQNSWMC